jgi:hypothetical protein
LLELDCIPAGMELFPATDEDAWTLIKEVIDGCDYYILILAGKYGSLSKEGISFTEMEFDYATTKGKPIMCFLFENIDSLPSSDCERNEVMQKKLSAFREKAQQKHCKFWTTADDLGGKVSRSMIQMKKKHPSAGWVPGIYAATEEMMQEMQELREKVSKYELEKVIGNQRQLFKTDELAQGDDPVQLNGLINSDQQNTKKKMNLVVTWYTLLSYFGPSMLNECTDEEMFKKVRLAYFHAIPKEIRDFNSLETIVLPYVFEDKIRVQFQALGIIASGVKRRTVKDTASYWRLTPYGEKLLLSIKAEKRDIQIPLIPESSDKSS